MKIILCTTSFFAGLLPAQKLVSQCHSYHIYFRIFYQISYQVSQHIMYNNRYHIITCIIIYIILFNMFVKSRDTWGGRNPDSWLINDHQFLLKGKVLTYSPQRPYWDIRVSQTTFTQLGQLWLNEKIIIYPVINYVLYHFIYHIINYILYHII